MVAWQAASSLGQGGGAAPSRAASSMVSNSTVGGTFEQDGILDKRAVRRERVESYLFCKSRREFVHFYLTSLLSCKIATWFACAVREKVLGTVLSGGIFDFYLTLL
jgi:hypothetical protein